MTDLASAPTMPATDSTKLDPGAAGPSAAGGGAPTTIPTEEPSLRDSIAAAVKEATPAEDKKDEAPADEKPDKDEPKGEGKKGAEKPEEGKKAPETAEAKKAPERAADGKFAAKQEAATDESGEESEDAKEDAGANAQRKQIEQGISQAPKHFLPDAKEKWANTPSPVRREVETLLRDHETAVERYKEAAERYEPIRQYDELVRQNGRAGIHETLAEVKQLEDLIAANPLAGLNQILLRAGPRKPDGSPVTLFEVAQAVVQMGQQGYQQTVSRAPQQQAPANDGDPRIQQLQAQIAQMQEQQLAVSVIEPFKAAHPRYDELKGDIAFFLKSGKIPDSLSAPERLEVAYDMAVRINPASHVEPAPESEARPDPGRADESFSGSTSIKSAPGAVTPNEEPDRGGSIREQLERAVRQQRRA